MSIKIKSHWLVLLTPAFFLPVLMRDGASLTDVVWDAVGITLVIQFLVILPHELGHFAGAMKVGIKRGTLFFGGLCGAWMPDDDYQFTCLPPKKRITIFLSGPLCNLLVAALCGIVFAVTPRHMQFHLVDLRYYIINFNLFLALFNMLPIFPLDGGRIFREVLILMKLRPSQILKCLRVAAISFGCGSSLYVFINGFWTDWVVWGLVMGVAFYLLMDKKLLLEELSKNTSRTAW